MKEWRRRSAGHCLNHTRWKVNCYVIQVLSFPLFIFNLTIFPLFFFKEDPANLKYVNICSLVMTVPKQNCGNHLRGEKS